MAPAPIKPTVRAPCPDYQTYAAKYHAPGSGGPRNLPFQRPPEYCRRFNSSVIENVIQDTTSKMKDPDLAQLFRNAFPNTLDTTVHNGCVNNTCDGLPKSFVITGDIPAMWIRDSTSQVNPYLPFAMQDLSLKNLILGVIYMQAQFLNIDPYANAFKMPTSQTDDGMNIAKRDVTDTIVPLQVWEEKYEIDSLANFLRLSHSYWNTTGDSSFTQSPTWMSAVEKVIETIHQQQEPTYNEADRPTKAFYKFVKESTSPEETQYLDGRGNPTARTGMVRSLFRPSDDATIFPFFIPGNAMMSVELHHLSELLNATNGNQTLSSIASTLSDEIRQAIYDYGVIDHNQYGKVLAYEVDGYGGHLVMDDANVPSLLSLPYLGFMDQNDPLYQNTRKLVLSRSNPYYFQGTRGAGVGGPHVGIGAIWPMSLITKIMTSSDDEEISSSLAIILNTTDSTGLIHESFDAWDQGVYTRPWFSWANGFFAEAILKIARERPHLIF
ncbi:hypothetical protein INT43_006906 [Umbelopsis isabellina]|uniref:Meiotically up-regulated gene 157 protein n=1 Tax=Mortierella isabellina TaxID=91625 RepID=A0A8H7PYC1_MORIS|nr:hypothetical protein INT43_006906 [Umbelopsis isabellina]